MTKHLRARRLTYPVLLTILSGVGLIASLLPSIERINMLKNPAIPLSCNLSPVIDCGIILNHPLSSLFGFPNTFIGMIVFSMLLALGIAALLGANLKKTWPLLLTLSSILLMFSFWFFGASLYVIGKVCFYCIFIWLASVPLFTYSLQGYLNETKLHSKRMKLLRKFIDEHALAAILASYIVLLALYFFNFRDFYF